MGVCFAEPRQRIEVLQSLRDPSSSFERVTSLTATYFITEKQPVIVTKNTYNMMNSHPSFPQDPTNGTVPTLKNVRELFQVDQESGP
jgi:hypothetical protein